MNFIYPGLITSAVSIMASEKKKKNHLCVPWPERGGTGYAEGTEVDRRRQLGREWNRRYLKNNIIFTFLHAVCLFGSAGRLAGLLANMTRIAAGFLPPIVCFFAAGRLGVV